MKKKLTISKETMKKVVEKFKEAEFERSKYFTPLPSLYKFKDLLIPYLISHKK